MYNVLGCNAFLLGIIYWKCFKKETINTREITIIVAAVNKFSLVNSYGDHGRKS